MTGSTSAAVRNIADMVRGSARRGADHPALIDAASGRTLSWAEVDAAVDAEAARLAERGARPGDRVAIRLPNTPEFCVAVLGAVRAGCVAMPIGLGAANRESERLLEDGGAGLLVGEGQAPGVTVLDPPALDVGEQPEFASRSGGEDIAVL